MNAVPRGICGSENRLTVTNDDDSVATMEWKNGTTVVADWDYTYDAAGRLIEVTTSFGESVEYAYDGEGKITVQTNGNGTTTEYTYNQERGWPTRIDHKLSGTSFARYDLTYDGGADTVGNITGVTELSGDTMAYTYDDLYRLTGETRTGSNSYTKTYGYDLAGNHTTLNGSSFATYDDANKISTIAGGSKTYDTSGNLLTISGTGIGSGTYTWETREKLRTQKYTGTTTYTYSYDWTGKKVARHSTGGGGSKFWYIFSGDQLVGEIGGDYPSGPFTTNVAYTWGADGLAAKRWITTSTSHYYHYGPQGETRQITDGSGTIKNTYVYSAYGLAIASTGSDYNRHRYGGKVGYFTDGPTTSPLILATHRWYNPELRRWSSRDPIEYAGGDNLYEYVGGNPVTFLDPSGLDSKNHLWHNVGMMLGGTLGGALSAGAVVQSAGTLAPVAPQVVGAGVAGGAAIGAAIGAGVDSLVDACWNMGRFEDGQKNFIYFEALKLANSTQRSICDILKEWAQQARAEGKTIRYLAIKKAQKAAKCRRRG